MQEPLLSPYHLTFYIEWKLDQNRSDYNLVFDQNLEGLIDTLRLDNAIKRFISDYAIINSHIENKQDKLYWVKNDSIHGLECYDGKLTNKLILSYVQESFNLETGPLYRFALIKISENKYRFIVVFHHIIIDGLTVDYLIDEISNYYNNSSYKFNTSIDEQLSKMSSLSLILMDRLESNRKQSEFFWKHKLANIEPLNLRFLKSYTKNHCLSDDCEVDKSIQQLSKINETRFSFDKNILLKLNKLKKKYLITPFLYCKTIYAMLLYRYTGQNNFFLSYPITINEGIDFIYGGHVNINVMPYNFENINNILDLFKESRNFYKSLKCDGMNHGYLPVYDIVSNSRKEILDLSFIQANFKDNLFSFHGITTTVNHDTCIDLTDQLLFAQEIRNENIGFRVRYKMDCIDTVLLKQFIDCYKRLFITILDELLELKDERQIKHIKNYDILTCDEYEKIIHKWNETDNNYSLENTIHSLFENQTEKTPNNIALIYKDTKLTYIQLNEKTNQLANYLKNTYEIKTEMFISLCLDRNEHMIIAILAVLKLGCTYVPIDPTYPSERIKYILKDTSPILMLTNEAHMQKLINLMSNSESMHKIDVLALDNQEIVLKLCSQSNSNLLIPVKSNNLAYIIYTSGTTGYPKGVMVEHKGLINLKYDLSFKYRMNNTDREVILQFANYVFDASVEQIMLALLNGYTLLLVPNELWLNKEEFYNYLNLNKTTYIETTPTFSSQYDFSKILTLKRLIFGGEVLSKDLYDKVVKSKSMQIINTYGPTEISITATMSIIKDEIITIGKPISNVKCYVLDKHLKPLPVGAIGELYIGGIGLARGYLNQQQLTEEKFVVNQFQTKKERQLNINSRLYKSGDFVRWLNDGNLEYVGRLDNQVKIRGYRIELEEIEKAILRYKGIHWSIVDVKEKKNQGQSLDSRYIVGYYMSDIVIDQHSILNHIRNILPEYMIPTILVHLDKLPISINGKINKRDLPEAEFIVDNYIPPRSDLEMKILQIWCETLGLTNEKVGIRDNFLTMGGDSIVGIQLVNRLRQRLNINLSVKDIFTYQNIERLYDNVLRKKINNNTQEIKTEQGLLKGALDLLPIQEWFFRSNFKVPHHWSQSFLIKTENLDINSLQQSLSKLFLYHDCFRLRYKKNDKNIIQYYKLDAEPEKLKILDINSLKTKESDEDVEGTLQSILTGWQSHFNIEIGPIYSVGYIYGFPDGSSRIFFALHHLITDTVSWRILLRDLNDIYFQNDLKSKRTSYRQWVEVIKNYSIKHQDEKVYWSNLLSDYNDQYFLMQCKSPVNCIRSYISSDQTKKLLTESNVPYHTQIMDILLTALGYALFELSNSRVNHIMLEGHGREEIDPYVDITRTAGWFTTMYPVRLEILDGYDKSIINIKETMRSIPNKGIGFGALLGYATNSLPLVSFNYLGQLNSELQSNFWNIANEKSGTSINPLNQFSNIIDINVYILDHRLEFTSETKLDETNANRLIKSFKQNLINIIEYTLNQKRSYLTASDIFNVINQSYLDKLQETCQIDNIFLANSLQQGFIYRALNQNQMDDAYVVQTIWQYNCLINESNLKEAWVCAQKKYGSLRLRFAWDQELVQIIEKDTNIDWRYIDLSLEKETEKSIYKKVKKIQENDRIETYDLEKGNLFRIYLIKHKEDLYTSIFSSHHAIIDGWSFPVLLNYVHNAYLNILNGTIEVPAIDYGYENTQKYLQEHKNLYNDWWNNYLSQVDNFEDLNGLLHVSNDRPTNIDNYRNIITPNEELLIISNDPYQNLKKVCRNYNVTLNAILQYVWSKALSVYSNANNTMTGMVVSGRNLPIDDIESSVGMFINTLPLIVNHPSEASIVDTIQVVQNNINEINIRNASSLSSIKKGNIRLFNNIFVYENYPNYNQNNDKLNITFTENIEKIDYPLGVTVFEVDEQILFKVGYASELFSNARIKDLLQTIQLLLEQVVSIPDKSAKNLKYLSNAQYKQMIEDWNETDTVYPIDNKIHELFEEQVRNTPNHVALVYENVSLTYMELNHKANQLAHYLRMNYDIRPDTIIALFLDRNEYMIIAILGILKSGAAYVPIDPSCPKERAKYIIEDTKSLLIITNTLYTEGLNSIKDSLKYDVILEIDDGKLWKKLQFLSKENHVNSISTSSLAYVIYTSGTTGLPKGVMLEHRGIVNLKYDLTFRYGMQDSEVENILQFSSYVFDASIEQIVLSLLNGYTLVLIPNQLWLEKDRFYSYLNKHAITHIDATPTILEQYDFRKIPSLKRIVCGGEPLRRDTYKKIALSDLKIINAYGLTETSVTSLVNIICEENQGIGKPIGNTKCYVLDENLRPVPIGAIGELHIGGAGVARGYLNQPKLTQEKFIDNPFKNNIDKKKLTNLKLYKTGDLVRWLPDGNLEYVGRKDLQVKIRGYRIELEEIGSILSSYEGISQSFVLAKEHKDQLGNYTENKYLVGYYVCENSLNEDKIKNYLKNKLPEYMIPSVFVHLSAFPLCANGKINRKAFPDPKFNNGMTYLSARNEIEEKICLVWGEVLQLDPSLIGIRNNFFDLGGNSILLISLKSKLENVLGVKNLKISDLFKYPSIEKFSNYVVKSDETTSHMSHVRNWATNKFDHRIAVIGMSGAFSNSEDIEEYWENIINGKECLKQISRENYEELGVSESILNDKNFITTGGVLKDIDKFDPEFWNISHHDAMLMDPQIRKFLEHSWIALEQSGYIRKCHKLKIGVFSGMSFSEYYESRIRGNPNLPQHMNLWEIENMNEKDFLSTRISYLLGLNGTSININTACSTSLVAIVEACKNLALGACDIALAGGVSFSMPENHGYTYREGMIFSKDGHCRVFDCDSSGTVGGVGVGVIILKRLQEAINDNDNIIGIIKGYATNNDGNRKVGYTAPSAIGQTECILEAQKMAGVTSDAITYVECHGTGTVLGDPIEVAALHDAFKMNLKIDKYSCILGSVKANIGHADIASGVAGFIKVCKMLETKMLPPQINFNKPNPALMLENTYFKIITIPQVWIRSNDKRRAGVSAFGIGGTNAHLILEEYEETQDEKKIVQDKYYIIPFSANSINSYKGFCRALEDYLRLNDSVDLIDISYVLQDRRQHFKIRNAIVCKNKEDAIKKLKNISEPVNVNTSRLSIVFMFPGQGAQYINMARGLYETESVFKENVDECCKIIFNILNIQFINCLYPTQNPPLEDFYETKWSQLALFIVCYALAKQLESLGINAFSYIGHSIGEYVAATLSGVFSLEDALKIITKRGELMQKMLAGSMLLVNADIEEIQKRLPSTLEIAVYNAPNVIVVSGRRHEIEEYKFILNRDNISFIDLNTSHAFHSCMMEEAAQEFELFMKHIHFKQNNKPFVSNVTGEFIRNDQVSSPQYWASHIRKPVLFSKGIETLSTSYNNVVFLEVGPGNTLSYFVNQNNKLHSLKVRCISILPTKNEIYRGDKDDVQALNEFVAKLWSLGQEIRWEKVRKTQDHLLKNIKLPSYQFEKNKCWIEPHKQTMENSKIIELKNSQCYQMSWERVKKVTSLSNIELKNKCGWLIFKDDSYLLDPFIRYLKGLNQLVIMVEHSKLSEHVQIQNDKIIINPYNELHYEELHQYLLSIDLNIKYIIHGWTITNVDPKQATEDLQYLGFYSLFHLHNIIFSVLKSEVYLFTITNGINQVSGRDVIHCGKGTILGAIRAIPHEISNIRATLLDIGFEKSIDHNFLLALIVSEKTYLSEPNYAIRSNYIWREKCELITLSELSQSPTLRNGDVVVITGGLSGVGLTMAKSISKHHKIKFILVNRNGIDNDKDSNLRKFQLDSLEFIKNNGSDVDINCCDITDAHGTRNVINSIKCKYGRISGVIHAAGARPLSYKDKTFLNVKRAISAKVFGAENLLNIFKDNDLNFFVTTSSLASIVGDVGRIEYCAANSYLDILCGCSVSNIEHIISINWPGWSFEYDEDSEPLITLSNKNNTNLNVLLQNNVTEKEGEAIFYKILNQRSHNQVVISKIDISDIKYKLFEHTHNTNSCEVQLKVENFIIEENSTMMEQKVASLFCKNLGNERLSKYVSYFELGGNSLSGLRLMNDINRFLNVNINIFVLLKENTVFRLANYLENYSENTNINFPVAIEEGEL